MWLAPDPNFLEEPNVPPGLSNVVAIAGGGYHSLALQSNATVVAWGDNYDGQTTVPPGLSNVVAITGGFVHSLAITLDTSVLSEPPPVISLTSGAGTNLSVAVWSGGPLGCQWSLNGLPIAWATGTTLVITNFGLTQAGVYSVLVTNQHGSATAVSVVCLTNSPVLLVDGVDVGGGPVSRVDSSQIIISSTFSPASEVYYTLDGTEPDFTAIRYSGAFTLTNSATLRAIAYNSTYTDSAEAAPIYIQIWPTYPLSTSTPGGGSISVSPAAYSGGNRYVSNTVVTLTATPFNGWSFIHWTGGSTATTNVTSALMNRPRAVQAVFGTSLNRFTNGNGQILLNPPAGPYPYGSVVQLTALPASGSYFFGWAGAASGFNNPLSIQATNASGMTALFGALNANQVSLTALPSGNGTVSVSPYKNVYTNGETVSLTAVPAANNVFTGWSGDASGSLNPLALVLNTSKLVTASFAAGTPTNPPVITQPPLSRTLSTGESTTLSFQVTGDGPFAYQWRFNGSPITGATGPILNLPRVTSSQAGLYSVVVTGLAGTATSSPTSVALFDLELAVSGSQTLPLLILDGAAGTRYRLECSGTLAPTNWTLLAPVTLGDSQFYYVDDPLTNHPWRFYRAMPQ
jgi:hypothetical protein